MKKTNKFYITSALPYTSSYPHIGNMYELILTDCIARFYKLAGHDVYFQTGTDEHGLKIAEKASEAKMSPKDYVDKIVAYIKDNLKLLNIEYDNFVRTTDDTHTEAVAKIADVMFKKGDIYLSSYEGLYSKAEEAYVSEKDLVDGLLPSGEKPILMKEVAYFFALSKYQAKLVKHIEDHPRFIMPESRRNEILAFLKEPLLDLCVTRSSFDWGVKVNFDKKHVLYVWLDALCNYITGIGYSPDKSSTKFSELWPANAHIVGKDITRFHCVYWPCFLMSLGLELPETVFGHPWVLTHQTKMSKSLGNTIYADEFVKTFGVDKVRFYCLSEIPFKDDGNLTYDLVLEKTNTELVNTLGNLVNRTFGMLAKYFDSKFKPTYTSFDKNFQEIDAYIESLPGKLTDLFQEYKVAEAAKTILELARTANKFIDLEEPWNLFKNQEHGKLMAVLTTLFKVIRVLSITLLPFIPESAKKIQAMLEISEDTLDSVLVKSPFKEIFFKKPEILFVRLDKKDLE